MIGRSWMSWIARPIASPPFDACPDLRIPNGSLRDPHGLPGEEDAVRELFSGAVGYFRNATSHRDVNLSANACADLLGFATQLLSIVDHRAQRRITGWVPP